MNLSTKDLAQAVEAWAADVTGFNSEAHQPTMLSEALPLVICEIKTDARDKRSPNIQELGPYEQTLVRARTAELLLMINPEPSWTASQTLYDAVDLLADALKDDQTLGSRVHLASKRYAAGYDPPEMQHADGTVARVARFVMYVGELV